MLIFCGLAVLGDYLYLSPNSHSQVVRFYRRGAGFTDRSAWSVFDTGPLINPPAHYAGLVVALQYVFFVPDANSPVVRYDTQKPFSSSTSWEMFDARTLINITGYYGAVHFQDTQSNYLYFSPWAASSTAFHGHVLRYNLDLPFNSITSWSTFDASNTDGHGGCVGYADVAIAKDALYFVPRQSGAGGFHGNVLRYALPVAPTPAPTPQSTATASDQMMTLSSTSSSTTVTVIVVLVLVLVVLGVVIIVVLVLRRRRLAIRQQQSPLPNNGSENVGNYASTTAVSPMAATGTPYGLLTESTTASSLSTTAAERHKATQYASTSQVFSDINQHAPTKYANASTVAPAGSQLYANASSMNIYANNSNVNRNAATTTTTPPTMIYANASVWQRQ
jgi:hypothetical protein